MKLKRSIVTMGLLFQCFFAFAQIQQPKLDSILKAWYAYSSNTVNLHTFKDYRLIYKPRYRFKYIPINFTATHKKTGFSKYLYGIRFYDTTNRRVYVLQKRKPRYFKKNREYSASTFFINDKPYYLPLDFKADDELGHIKTDSMQLNVNAWLIYEVNKHSVLPFLLIKNVKKY